MKGLKIAVWVMISFSLMLPLAMAAGDAEKGKALFSDPKLGGGTAGVSCNSCHPDGKGMEKAGEMKGLEKQINACIKGPLKGKGIDAKSPEMADIIAYIKSLKAKAPGPTPKK
jgi:cytochrome c553